MEQRQDAICRLFEDLGIRANVVALEEPPVARYYDLMVQGQFLVLNSLIVVGVTVGGRRLQVDLAAPVEPSQVVGLAVLHKVRSGKRDAADHFRGACAELLVWVEDRGSNGRV